MSTRTEFAGLTALAPGEPLSTDGYAFQAVNPLIIDPLLKLGARTHRHDEHPPIANPIDAPGVTLTPDGNLPADADIAITYTLIDADGGETLAAPTTLVTTAPAMEAPDGGAAVEVQDVGGHMTAGTYTYAISLTDPNGETPVGAPFFVDVPAGTDTNVVILTGFSDIVAATPGATGWRLYKSSSVGQLHFLAAGGVGLDEVTDDGMLCADCAVTPATQNTTSVSQGLEVVVPASVTNSATGVVAYRVYAAVGGAFASPSYVEQRVDFGEVLDYTHIVVNPGMPPDVSTSFGGAQKLNPDTELLDWHWKRPVATQADLPEPADDGDVRIVTEDGTLWTYDADDTLWRQFEAPSMYWKPAVNDVSLLPPAASGVNIVGDVRLVMLDRTLWMFGATEQWINITSPQPFVRSDIATMPQRGALQFLNATVVDDEANNTTVITALGGGGGGLDDLKLAISGGESIEWVDDAGVTQLKLEGRRNTADSPWFFDPFDEPPLMEWGGSGGNVGVDVDGNMAPLVTHPLMQDRSYWKGPGGTVKEFEITAGGLVLTSIDFNSIGIGLVNGANGEQGFHLKLIQYDDAGTPAFRAELKYRLLEADPWTIIQEWPVDPATIIIGEHHGMRLRRDGNKLMVGMWNYDSGTDSFNGEDIDVPDAMIAFQGVPCVCSNITAVDSWKMDSFEALYILSSYQLLANGTVLTDTAPNPYDWMNNPGDAAAGWYPDFAVRKTPTNGLEFRGKITKGDDAGPLPGELMFSFDAARMYAPNTTVVVITGDVDGKEIGMLEFSSGDNTMRWASGRATDPVTKMPYVSLDGLALN